MSLNQQPLHPPVEVRLTVLSDVPCPYLPEKTETLRAVMTSSIDGETYRAFLDAGFRRSGRMLYQPVCRDCVACVPIRVPVDRFQPSKSQRRCMRRNEDLVVHVGRPHLTDEKFDLYSRYVHDWHKRPEEADREALKTFLYESPTQTVEFTYRDAARKLLGVGICDLSSTSLSSVYFYFEPEASHRSLGTYGALRELDWCRQRGISQYYLGYWIADCGAMAYKAAFRPYELLGADGGWHAAE